MTSHAETPPARTNRDAIGTAAAAIEPLLNRVVFTGRHVADYLTTEWMERNTGSAFNYSASVHVLCSGSLDRIASEMQQLGLERGARTATTERFVVDARVTIEMEHVSGDENDPAAIWLEYASLLTMVAKLERPAAPLSVRITGAPALLALGWSVYGESGESPLDSAELEDIITLTAGRAELGRELTAAPPELRAFVGQETRRFLAYDGAEHVIHAALPSANRSAAMVGRVLERMRTFTAPASGS